jgi:sugar lactone lactonase YvrE
MPERSTRLLADGFHFLESPRWRHDRLWISDIGARQLLVLTADGAVEQTIPVPARPSGLGFLPDGTPVVASMEDRCLYRVVRGGLEVHTDLSRLAKAPISDMVIDAEGRAYVDDIGYDLLAGENRAPGRILLAAPDGSVRVVASGLDLPNGIAVSPAGRLILAESFGRRILSYAIAEEGGLTDRVVLADMPCGPDGLCVDAEGGVWVALVEEGCAYVREGSIVDVVRAEGAKVIACALGGPDGRTLFCATYTGRLADIGRVPGSRLEAARVDIPQASASDSTTKRGSADVDRAG